MSLMRQLGGKKPTQFQRVSYIPLHIIHIYYISWDALNFKHSVDQNFKGFNALRNTQLLIFQQQYF